MNSYSVVTDDIPTIIAAADVQHLFRLCAEVGKDLLREMRETAKKKQSDMFLQYYKSQLERKDQVNKVRQDKIKSDELQQGEKIKKEMCDKVMTYYSQADDFLKEKLEVQFKEKVKKGEKLSFGRTKTRELTGAVENNDNKQLNKLK